MAGGGKTYVYGGARGRSAKAVRRGVAKRT